MMSFAEGPGCVATAAQARLWRVHAMLAELLADATGLLVVLPPSCGVAALGPQAAEDGAGSDLQEAARAGWWSAACATGALALAAAVPSPPPMVGMVLCSVAVPKAIQLGGLVIFVGGLSAAFGSELRSRQRQMLTDEVLGAGDQEHAAMLRLVEESRMQARAHIRAHLQEFLGGRPQARFEEWIEVYHPDNVIPPGRDSRGLPTIDRRHYHERSEHRMIWNKRVNDQRRHVSQFSLWLAEEAERAAARAEHGLAWPEDDEPAPEAGADHVTYPHTLSRHAPHHVDNMKQVILSGSLPVSVFNQSSQLERQRLVLDTRVRRLSIQEFEDRADDGDGKPEDSWDVDNLHSITKGIPSSILASPPSPDCALTLQFRFSEVDVEEDRFLCVILDSADTSLLVAEALSQLCSVPVVLP